MRLEATYLERLGVTIDRTDATPVLVDKLRHNGHKAQMLDARSTRPSGYLAMTRKEGDGGGLELGEAWQAALVRDERMATRLSSMMGGGQRRSPGVDDVQRDALGLRG